jgi:hypothetical protein
MQQTINNENVKLDNVRKENENLVKVVESGERIVQTNEALVCEFSPVAN